MSPKRRLAAVSVGLTFALGCAPAPASDTAVDVEAIKQAFAGWVAVSEAGDADGYITYITDDALFLVPGQPPIAGKATIRPWIAQFFADWTFSFPEWSTDEIVVAGDIAVHRYSGATTLAPKTGGETVVADRKYMDLLRKETDGRWRVARHMFNLNQ